MLFHSAPAFLLVSALFVNASPLIRRQGEIDDGFDNPSEQARQPLSTATPVKSQEPITAFQSEIREPKTSIDVANGAGTPLSTAHADSKPTKEPTRPDVSTLETRIQPDQAQSTAAGDSGQPHTKPASGRIRPSASSDNPASFEGTTLPLSTNRFLPTRTAVAPFSEVPVPTTSVAGSSSNVPLQLIGTFSSLGNPGLLIPSGPASFSKPNAVSVTRAANPKFQTANVPQATQPTTAIMTLLSSILGGLGTSVQPDEATIHPIPATTQPPGVMNTLAPSTSSSFTGLIVPISTSNPQAQVTGAAQALTSGAVTPIVSGVATALSSPGALASASTTTNGIQFYLQKVNNFVAANSNSASVSDFPPASSSAKSASACPSVAQEMAELVGNATTKNGSTLASSQVLPILPAGSAFVVGNSPVQVVSHQGQSLAFQFLGEDCESSTSADGSGGFLDLGLLKRQDLIRRRINFLEVIESLVAPGLPGLLGPAGPP